MSFPNFLSVDFNVHALKKDEVFLINMKLSKATKFLVLLVIKMFLSKAFAAVSLKSGVISF